MKILPVILVLSFVVMSCGALATQRPNVVLIYADDLGMGMLSRYGQKIVTTPNIDRLAAEGIEFTNYHANTFCAPSRASLLNGLHDGRVGLGSHSRGGFIVKLDKNIPKLSEEQWQRQYDSHIQKRSAKTRIDDATLLLAQVAKNAGYRTAQFGKLDTGFLTWHERVTRHGWDHYVGYYDHIRAHGFYPSYLWKNGNKLHLKGNPYANAGKRSEQGKEPVGAGGETYSQNVFLDEMLSFMRDHKKNHRDKPFFLYHSTQLPHGPVAIDKLHADYANRKDLTLSEKKYASMVKMLDDHVGRLMQELKTLGMDENTIVFFTSDNGHETYYQNKQGILPKLNKTQLMDGSKADFEKNKWRTSNGGDIFNGGAGMANSKRSGFQGGIRTPMIVRMPGQIAANTKTNRLTTNYDFLPTLASLVGSTDKRVSSKDGLSYLPTLLGKESQEHSWIFVRGGRVMKGVVIDNKGWKFAQFKDGTQQLYSLRENHFEENNVIKQHPEVAKRLKAIFDQEFNSDWP